MDEKFKKNINTAFFTYPKAFLPQEKIYTCASSIFLTEFRLLQLSVMGKTKNDIPLENVKGFSADTKGWIKVGTLLVEIKDGTSINFGNVYDKEFEEFQRVLAIIQSGQLPEYIEAPAAKEKPKEVTKQKDDVKSPVKQETGEAVPNQRVVRAAPPYYGTLTANETFGNYRVRVFSDGYIQVSTGLGLIKGSIEKLLQIDCEAQISKKTGLGRGLATIVTAGANQLSPNQRGNLILTITTDKKVHVLFQEMPFAHDIKGMNKLVAAGKSVINQNKKSAPIDLPKISSDNQNLAQQIRELSELKDSGVITQQEFEAAKQKLLS